ncbi:retinol dehydrogenase 12 isoform X1 [Denticeps clupeoides]|uniref:retinol dehydrogenase 12 isoform X1 n=1 Tax=Denticeps clupeoides TaxID=299321 RepID=UPI0010A53CC7|nr:retinol dehydrogenase 12-like isoform X1 [Denticeps clupeoides]
MRGSALPCSLFTHCKPDRRGGSSSRSSRGSADSSPVRSSMHSIRNVFCGQWSSTVRLDDKTIIVTGANTGIGKETVRDLAKRGGRVIMACRDLERGEEARREVAENGGHQNVVVRKLDLSDAKSIRAFAEQVIRGTALSSTCGPRWPTAADVLHPLCFLSLEEKRVNILVNNAGVMLCPYSKTADGFEMQFGVNHLGHFLLTYLLMDLMKKSAPARIVNVASVAHTWGSIQLDDINSERGYNARRAYGQSKLANILCTRSLAKRLQGTGVTVYSLHPGVVQTDLWRHLSKPMQVAVKIFSPFTKTSVQGAQTSIYCAVEPKLEKESGDYYSDCAPARCSRAASDDAMAQKLWELSCQMLGITWD